MSSSSSSVGVSSSRSSRRSSVRLRVTLSLGLGRSREELRTRGSRMVALVGETSSEGVLEGSEREGRKGEKKVSERVLGQTRATREERKGNEKGFDSLSMQNSGTRLNRSNTLSSLSVGSSEVVVRSWKDRNPSVPRLLLLRSGLEEVVGSVGHGVSSVLTRNGGRDGWGGWFGGDEELLVG